MLSKLSRNLSNKTSGNLGLKIHNNQSMVKVSLTHREIDLKKTSPSHMKRRVIGIRMTLGSGGTSTKSLGTTLMNVAQNSHWWSS
jgi:hypothetical protein